jgi:hypothetical protein
MISIAGAAESDAPPGGVFEIDEDLAKLISRWPMLSKNTRAAIVVLVTLQ